MKTLKSASIAFVRASVFSPMINALGAAGVDTCRFLKAYGLGPALLADSYSIVPLSDYVAAMEGAARTLNDPCLGIKLGSSVEPELLGPLGILFETADTIREALAKLSLYAATWQGGTLNELCDDGDRVHFNYAIQISSIWPRRQDAEFSLASACTFIRIALGRSWNPVAVEFEHHGDGKRAANLRGYFGAPIRFAGRTNRIVLKASDIDRPLRLQRNKAGPFIERHLQDLLGDVNGSLSLVQQVTRIIAKDLQGDQLSVSHIANLLGMSPRSLQRSLAQERTSLRHLVSKERLAAAAALIKNREMSLQEVAERVGYRDASVLSRAFRGWTGFSPSQLRNGERSC